MIDLVERGVITGERKSLHPGKIVAGFLMGSQRLYDFVDDNPIIELHPTDYVNDPFIIAQNRKMVAVNSAIEVDLTGQVCADSIGTRLYSGVGGQMDFIYGAARSVDGIPIIALPSTLRRPDKPAMSKIVPTLNLGAGSTVTALSIKAWSPTGGIKSVKLFDNTVTTGAFNPVQNLFENPNGWVWSTTAALPVYDPNQPNKLRIVDETTEGLYTVKSLSENQDYAPLKAGSFGMGAQFDWTWTDEWWITIADLDFGAQPRMAGYYIEQDYWGNPDNLLAQWKATVAPGVGEPWPIATQGLADFYFILPSCNALLGFFEEAMPAPGLYEAYYAGVNRRTIVDAYNAGQFTKGWLKNGKAQQPAWGFAYGSVFFFKTPEGRFGKLLITDASGFRDGWTETCGVGFHASYAIYNAP